MAPYKGKLLATKRSNKALWAAIGGSFAVHAFFFGSNIISPAPQIKPQPYPVIFAELRQQEPQQAQLTQAQAEQAQKQHSEPSSEPVATSSANSSELTARSVNITDKENKPAIVTSSRQAIKKSTVADSDSSKASTVKNTEPASLVTKVSESETQPQTTSTEAAALINQTEQSGLAVSKDLLSSDPLELEYQQKVLAHLRKSLLAPKHYSGSVRVEIRFSYRQIATDVKVVLSSGNPFFDDWAVKAILVANPFPPVPKELGDDYVFRPTLKVTP